MTLSSRRLASCRLSLCGIEMINGSDITLLRLSRPVTAGHLAVMSGRFDETDFVRQRIRRRTPIEGLVSPSAAAATYQRPDRADSTARHLAPPRQRAFDRWIGRGPKHGSAGDDVGRGTSGSRISDTDRV
jgi:hypothetical protein